MNVFMTTEQTLPLMTDLKSSIIEQNMTLAHRTGIINFNLRDIRGTYCMLV